MKVGLQIYLGIIWYDRWICAELDVAMAAAFWQFCVFQNWDFCAFINKNFNADVFTFLGLLSPVLCLWVISSNFSRFSNVSGKFWNPRWGLFGHHDVIVTWCDVITQRDMYQKIDFWTYYILCQFHCQGFNFLKVMDGVGGICTPRSEKIQSINIYTAEVDLWENLVARLITCHS